LQHVNKCVLLQPQILHNFFKLKIIYLKATLQPIKTPSVNTRVTRSSKLFKTIIAAIQDKKGEHIVSMDLKKIDEAIADYFIICQAGNHVQLGAIVDNIAEETRKQLGEKPYRTEGKRGNHWILIDYVSIVVHCFTPETRDFYGLEEMWSDADCKEHND
jgi:ribosome-associated protein